MTSTGRLAMGVVAIIVIGFCLGVASHVNLPLESLLALIGGATALLLLASFDRR